MIDNCRGEEGGKWREGLSGATKQGLVTVAGVAGVCSCHVQLLELARKSKREACRPVWTWSR